MGTSSMVPYSNPAGKNQTSPAATAPGVGVTALPTPSPLNPTQAATSNPLIPSVPTAGLPGTTTPAPQTDQSKQLVDILGKGVGGDLNTLLSSIGGVDSATLQEYVKSLAPQEAQADANLHASLGAGGVSANSSVAALGEANLQAQETGLIAGEEAQLTQSGQNLEASILTGLEPAAEKEVAESGWDVFGQVASAAGGLVKDLFPKGI